MESLTIKTVAERTGVSVHVLRQWERRYGVPLPNRNADNRYRLYDDNDIADVIWMKQQIDSGVSPSQASALLQRQRISLKPMAVAAPAQPVVTLQSALQTALLKSDETSARQLLDQAFAMHAPEQVALQIIEPTMLAIGESWMRNEITVSQEHLASNLIRQRLFSVLQSQPTALASAPHLLAACAPNEEHELGLLMVTLVARRQGWRTTYLGQGTPLVDIVRHAELVKPRVIVLSLTTVPGLLGMVPWLQKENRPAAQVVFGGRLLSLLPRLREHLPGTFLQGDLLTAVRGLQTLEPKTSFWAPSKKSWSIALTLKSERLRIASDTVDAMMPNRLSEMQRSEMSQQVSYSTLYLTDALVCALAFDVPELMDLHRAWLEQAMPVRAVSTQVLAKHRQVYAQALGKTLSQDEMEYCQPLIDRLVEN
jgi:DNA-binding transcriptional MerR regulator